MKAASFFFLALLFIAPQPPPQAPPVHPRPPQAPPAWAQPPVIKPPLAVKPRAVTYVTKTVVTYRNPVGHTHTCPFHRNTPWDHRSNPGHNCPTCKFEQLEQDPLPRMIPMWQSIRVPVLP